MKSTVVAITLCMLLSHALASTVTDTCDDRRLELERQMATAGANNNFDQVNSLQTTLNQLNARCTPSAIAQRHAIQYHSNAEAIAKHQRKVDEARAELERVKAKGDQ
jgi:hypothetical protein